MRKIIIYQILTRLYRNRLSANEENGSIKENGSGKLNDISGDVLRKIASKGITHVWFTGIIRHASKTDYSQFGIPKSHPAVVKGNAGSPYAITDYYDIDPDLADNVADRMREYEKLIERTHKARLGVIMDFVPNHVARQYHSTCAPKGIEGLGDRDDPSKGFDPVNNNFYYCTGQALMPVGLDLCSGEKEPYREMPAKATGNDRFDAYPNQNDWFETVKLNYGVDYYAGGIHHFTPIPSTWNKMLHILLFWASKGIDGFRCDMAEMVPAEFWQWAIEKLKADYPNILIIGEVYNPTLYKRYLEAGFDYLYDKVGLYDTLRAVTCGYAPAKAITGAWQANDYIGDHMLNFLENHDEQRIASQFFAGDALKAIPALAVSLLMDRKPFMLYFGQQYGEKGMDKEGFSGIDGRTTIFDYWNPSSVRREALGELTENERLVEGIYERLLRIAQSEKAITEGQFFDLMYANPGSSAFNPNTCYAFLRKSDDTLMVIAANFGDKEANISVKIPSHAFDHLGIKEGIFPAYDLMRDEKRQAELRRDGTIPLEISAYGTVILRIGLEEI